MVPSHCIGAVELSFGMWFANHEVVAVPSRGRQVDLGR
jgi:hypothetical protein